MFLIDLSLNDKNTHRHHLLSLLSKSLIILKIPKSNKKPPRRKHLEGSFTMRSAVRLSLPHGFRPVTLRHRLSVVLPFRCQSKMKQMGYDLYINLIMESLLNPIRPYLERKTNFFNNTSSIWTVNKINAYKNNQWQDNFENPRLPHAALKM
jgi:hypothetical protein